MRPVPGRWIVIAILAFIGIVVGLAAWYLFFGPGSPSHHIS
jgi:hypothetical protein